jgi:hypothetical protein
LRHTAGHRRYTIQPRMTGHEWDAAADRALASAVAEQEPDTHHDVDWKSIHGPPSTQTSRVRLRALCKRVRDADYKPLHEVLQLVIAELDAEDA